MIRKCIALGALGLWAGMAQAGTLTVSGQGTASAVPDVAMISMGVRQTARQAAVAMDRVAIDSNAVLAALRAEGLEDRDIQTSRISLNPNWDYDAQRVTGFTASVSFHVTLRDLSRVGEVLAVATELGGNSFGGFSMGIDDPSALEAQARAAAVSDALGKARQYAEAAGVTLGDILTIHEGGGGGMYVEPMMAMAEARGAVAIEVAAGETSVSQSVTLEIAFD